jgi:hypothetical protein
MEEYWICRKMKLLEKKLLGKGTKKRVVFMPVMKIDKGNKVELVEDGHGHMWSDYRIFVTRRKMEYANND